MPPSPAVTSEVSAHLEALTNPTRRRDADRLIEIMGRITGEPAQLHGTIIGFGRYEYRYDSGRAGSGPAASFAPRKAHTVVYLMDGVDARPDLVERLGKHTSGVGCLYLTSLDAVDLTVLEEMIGHSYRTLTAGVFGQRAREGNER